MAAATPGRPSVCAFTRLGWAIGRRDWTAVTAALSATVRVGYTELFGGEVSWPGARWLGL
jgi:hypothetical protein